MNINTDRYFKAIGIQPDRITFLNRWHKKSWDKFYNKYEQEFHEHNKLSSDAYDYLSYDEYHKLEKVIKKLSPTHTHRFEYFFVNIPSNIHTWLCCGFKWYYDKSIKQWTWFDNYHMISKLCRYQSWKNTHITWWDRIRFKLITGYNFE